MWSNAERSRLAVAAAWPSASDTSEPQEWQNFASSATGVLQCAQIAKVLKSF
jgi:hypothetical protein